MRGSMRIQDTTPEFRAITVCLNGSTERQLAVNVTELRKALGLPPYSLIAESVFSRFVPPSEPTDDVAEVDHESD